MTQTEQNKLSVRSEEQIAVRDSLTAAVRNCEATFFFSPPPSRYSAKCDRTFLATVTLEHESHISQGCPMLQGGYTLYEKC